MIKKIYLTTESGKLLKYEKGLSKILFDHPKKLPLMGIQKIRNLLYFSSKNQLFCLNLRKNTIKKSKIFYSKNFFQKEFMPDFHHFLIHKNKIYITSTRNNQIWVFDLKFNLQKKITIKGPKFFLPINFKRNYNHINSIFLNNIFFYINLNQYKKQYGSSGYVCLDKNFREIFRKEFAWTSHKFTIFNNDKFVICGPSIDNKKFPYAGLVKNDKIVFKHSNKIFCKDYHINDNQIILVGGYFSPRETRKKSDGIIFVLNKKFKLKNKIIIKNIGGIKGISI